MCMICPWCERIETVCDAHPCDVKLIPHQMREIKARKAERRLQAEHPPAQEPER